MQKKSYKGTFKSMTDEGLATVVFATLNVVDHDGDITVPGAFGIQTAKLSPAHDWNAPNMGMAKIREENDQVIAEIKFYLDMESGREWYTSIKRNFDEGVAQEYSYGFEILQKDTRVVDGRSVRGLLALKVLEVSPVMLGAGIGTQTVSVKSLRAKHGEENQKAYVQLSGSWEETQSQLCEILRYELLGDLDGYVCIEGTFPTYVVASRYLWGDNPDLEAMSYWRFDWSSQNGMLTISNRAQVALAASVVEKNSKRFVDQPGRIVALLTDLENRTKALVRLRAKEGRTLSRATRDELSKATESIRTAASTIDGLLAESDKPAETQTAAPKESEADQIVKRIELDEISKAFGLVRS